MKNFAYHQKQFSEIKRSTMAFATWLDNNVELRDANIMDIACGGGKSLLFRRAISYYKVYGD